MLRARRGGWTAALLVVMTVLAPTGAGAQDAEKPPADAPAEEKPADQPPAEQPSDRPRDEGQEDAQEEPSDEVDAEDADEDEWITPDVGADQREEDDQETTEDVDEVIVEYGESEGAEDKVTDAKGKEIDEVAVPVVSKAVEVQDPDNLEPGADKETGVQGQVVSRRPKKVLPDAPVLAKSEDDGKLRSTLTDDRGRYRLYLPPGKYTLRSYYDLYHGARWDDIQVTRGAFKRINFILDPISEEDAGVEELEVIYLADTTTEAAQIAIRKETVGVQDAISAEEIKRAGDSTAKGAVARVVGITIDEGGRIIIRGLADRYNRVLLNGIPIPGVDPDVPSVKLDIFPTEVVANLAIVKVPRPDLPGNFAGGLLMIDTNKYPSEQLIKVGLSTGANSMSAFRQMPTYRGGRLDPLGFDDGTRSIPGAVGNDRLIVGAAGDGSRYQSTDQVNQVGRTFPNIWNPQTRTAVPELGLKFAVGNSGDLDRLKEGRRGGYLLSLLYEYEDLIRTGFNRRYTFNAEGETQRLLRDFDYERGEQQVLWGTFASGFIELNRDNFLNVTSLFSRASEDETILQLGGREDTDFLLTSENSYNFIGRSLFFNQLTGDHRNLGKTKLRLQWNGTVATGKRDEPDRRNVEQFVESQQVTDAIRFYSDLDQLALGGTSDLRFPVYQAFERQAYGSVGAIASWLERDFAARRFQYANAANQRLVGDPEVLFGDTGLGTASRISEVTRPDDSYVGDQILYGGYAQLETPMTPWASFLGLLRVEVFEQQVESQSPFATTVEPVPGTDRRDLDFLPSTNFKFDINEKMFVKVGWGMTVIRPELRELAPFTYVDFLRGWVITGNPDLLRTQVQNAEARYEFFFGAADLFAATVFGKYLKKPIEFVIFNQVNGSAGYANADRAWVVGGELELRLGFGRFTEKLDKLFFQANIAVVGSQTKLPEGQGISGRLQRRLFNQSPFVTNASLRFDDPDSGVAVGLVYNTFGSRIVEAGASAGDFIVPDVFEQTQHYLDLVVSYQPVEHWKVGLKWKNIAFTKIVYTQGDVDVFLKNLGTSVSISGEYSY